MTDLLAVIEADRELQEELAALSKSRFDVTGEIVTLWGQVGRFANAVIENGAEILREAEAPPS